MSTNRFSPTLKLQSGVFPLWRHLCSKSAIAVIRGIINFTWVVVQHPGHCTAWMNTMFEESVRLSFTTPVWILSFRITVYSFWKYDQHKNFYRKMSSELVRNIHFCSGSDFAVNRAD